MKARWLGGGSLKRAVVSLHVGLVTTSKENDEVDYGDEAMPFYSQETSNFHSRVEESDENYASGASGYPRESPW